MPERLSLILSTQSESLGLFYDVRRSLERHFQIDRTGFIVADSWSYRKWLAAQPEFERQGFSILKEWDVTSRRQDAIDVDALSKMERDFGGPAGLFGAIVADRRLFMGPNCTFTQDYRRRFSDDELLSILQAAATSVERLFDEVRPDLVTGFICVTVLDYLTALVSRRRGIPYLNLRPTRIGNRIMLGSTLNDPTPELIAEISRTAAVGSPRLAEAREYVRRVRERHGRYEGVVAPSAEPALKLNRDRRSPWAIARRTAANYLAYRTSVSASDNHVADPLRALLFNAVINRIRARASARFLGPSDVKENDLASRRYAFFPLHTEPEVSLLVYGRPLVNQIEVVRWLAMSLPADMILVVKEHPWMVGKRTISAYRKMLNIPRVRFVRPDLDARVLVQGAAIVAVVTGSVALEAAILGKPVVTFGDCPYNALPSTMVHHCRDIRALPSVLLKMIDGYENDETALETYVSATLALSEGINLYSELLEKPGVHADHAADRANEIEKLTAFLIRRFRDVITPRSAASAEW